MSSYQRGLNVLKKVFFVGDMYYEAKSILITHPGIAYDDGIRHIFLYCKLMQRRANL